MTFAVGLIIGTLVGILLLLIVREKNKDTRPNWRWLSEEAKREREAHETAMRWLQKNDGGPPWSVQCAAAGGGGPPADGAARLETEVTSALATASEICEGPVG